MKKLYFLAVTLLLTAFSYGQAVFINEIHYDNGGTDVDEAVEIAGPAGTDLTGYTLVAYNGNNGEQYQTITLSGTITDQDDGYGTISFPFTGLQNGAPDGIALADSSNNVIQFLSYEGSFTAVDNVASGMTSTDIGVAEIGTDPGESLQLGGSGTDYTNFTWQESMANTMGAVNTNQDFGGTPMPGLTITNPTDGSTLSPEASTSMDVTFTVSNFIVANGSGDGHVHYFVDGETNPNMVYTTDPITLTGLSTGSHTVYMELVDNSHNPITPAVNDEVTFTIAEYINVANLASLRSGTEGEYYRVTGEVFGTYAQNYRNQKWVQDSSAGIKIDDNTGVITTVYNEGDGVVNLRGKLTSYNDVLQLQPTADPGAASSTGNTITPEVITLAQLTAGLSNYESELVKILAVTVADVADGDGTFQASKNYPISVGADESFLRTAFHDADYVVNHDLLPTVPKDFVFIVGGYNGVAQVTPRDAGDILGVSKMNTIDSFSLYPNPVTNGIITITTKDNLSKKIQIFDILGKQVFTTNTAKTTINIASLKKGIYIIKVEEAGQFVTRKLIVE